MNSVQSIVDYLLFGEGDVEEGDVRDGDVRDGDVGGLDLQILGEFIGELVFRGCSMMGFLIEMFLFM